MLCLLLAAATVAPVATGTDAGAPGQSSQVPSGEPSQPAYVEASRVEVYKDFDAWFGENTVEDVLSNELGLVKGDSSGFGVRPTSELLAQIPADAQMVILTSNSFGDGSTLSNVNAPASQSNLEAFVQDGGVLVVHLADNVWYDSFKAPGIDRDLNAGPFEDFLELAAPSHPIAVGPDGIPTTSDDYTASNVSYFANAAIHGYLPALPANAEVVLTKNGNPVMATYEYGAGHVVVDSMTMEWRLTPRHMLVNELAYAFSLAGGGPSNTPPEVTLPSAMEVEGNTTGGANVAYAGISASDAEDGDLTGAVLCTPASGSFFALGGPTSVSCSVTDSDGESDSGSFNVTVVDTTAPTLNGVPGDITVNPASGSSAAVTYTDPTATDIVDASPVVACTPASGSTFPIGHSTVTCTATDDSENSSEDTFDVFVSYDFKGFFAPVDNIPTVNTVKAGSAIPIKFSLTGNQGMSIFAVGSPSSKKINCNSGGDLDSIEETVNPGSSTLTYDAGADKYQYVWKSVKSYAGTCRQLDVKLSDGTTKSALFMFK